MAKSIIESQHGDIYVKSEKNKGAEFHIVFPIKPTVTNMSL